MVDRVRTGLGAHRRWMLLALLPLSLLLLALVTLGDRLPFAALFLMMVFFYSSYSLYEVAQLSWGSALVRTPADSALLYGMRDWFAKIALILAFAAPAARSEEHTSELQSLMRISYAVFCLKKQK